MTSQQVEYLVIGGGPGGTPAAMALAAAGKSVLLVEQGPGLGGTCLFEGCIPSKLFREAARHLPGQTIAFPRPETNTAVHWHRREATTDFV
jgi:pyruvate/2-oxoglutarate dehydrogenase complex dihydrolipoamide dehydrogenase (E3) component